MITKVKFENFTVFEKLEIPCSPGINIFIGENGTGKTHILKAIYIACDITRSGGTLHGKLLRVFLPSRGEIGRLVKRSSASGAGFVELYRSLPEKKKEIIVRVSINKSSKGIKISGSKAAWMETKLQSTYIPVKEMLSNAPGFRSLYNLREIHFDEVYADILDRAFLDPLIKSQLNKNISKLSELLQEKMGGKVIRKNEEFFLRNRQGELEFSLLAEGIRKLGLLWLLMQNGTFSEGSVLFWDEPEANLNPKLMEVVVKVLLELQRAGVQIFLATHNYVTLKEFDLQVEAGDNVSFHSLYRSEDTKEIAVKSTPDYLEIHPNAIDDTFADLVDRDIERSMGGLGK